MNSNDDDNIKKELEGNEDAPVKPNPKTLHTTDPQEEMEGPISSLVQASKEVIEENSKEQNKEGAVIIAQ